MSGFPYKFPIWLRVPRLYRLGWSVEVRDAGDRLTRMAASVVKARVSGGINEPGLLELTVPLNDPAAAALAGANEIWVRDSDGAVGGKFRMAAGSRVDSQSGRGGEATVRAYDYLSQLGEEQVVNHEDWRNMTDLVGGLLALQLSARPVTAGALPASIASVVRKLRVDQQSTILGALLTLVGGLDPRIQFWVDNDRVLQWRDLDAQGDTGKHLEVGKNIQSLERHYDYSAWATRFYGYGSKASGRHLTLGDGAQGWSVWVEAASAGQATLTHVKTGYDNPNALVGYDSEATRVRVGDNLSALAVAREITGAARGVDSTVVTFRGDHVYAVGGVGLAREFLDSALRGVEFIKRVTLDHTQFSPLGEVDYPAVIQVTDEDVAAMEPAGRTAAVKAFSADGRTELEVVVSDLDTTTGEVDITVTVPKASGVVDTIFQLAFGWVVV